MSRLLPLIGIVAGIVFLLVIIGTSRSADVLPSPTTSDPIRTNCFSAEAIKLGFIERGMLPAVTGFIDGNMLTVWADNGGGAFAIVMIDANLSRGCITSFGHSLRYHSFLPPAGD